jgi:hypothetical protein
MEVLVMGMNDGTHEMNDMQMHQENAPNQTKWVMNMVESLQKSNAELYRKIDSLASKIADMEKRMSMLTMSMNSRPKSQGLQQNMGQNGFQQAAYQQQGVPQGLPQGGQQGGFGQMPQQGFAQQQQFAQQPQQGFVQQGFAGQQQGFAGQQQGFVQQQQPQFAQMPQQQFAQQPQQEYAQQPQQDFNTAVEGGETNSYQ